MYKYIISFFVLLIGFILIKSIDIRKRLTFYINRIDKTNDSIKDNLVKKYELLVKQIKLFKNKKKIKEDDYSDFLSINTKEIPLIKLDDEINNYKKMLDIILQYNNKLVKDHHIKENINDIEKVDVTIKGLKKYHNTLVLKYNHYRNKLLSRLISKIYKFNKINEYEITK